MLTKHSLSRDQFLDLVKRYDCQYRDGRAESAPQLRTGTSSKITMASSNVNAVDEDEEELKAEEETAGTKPWMPHLMLTEDELDAQFPSLEVPEDDGLEDPNQDDDDAMLQHGMSIAREIADGMLRNGRTRRDCVDGSFR